jgi:hypothetical protein
MRYTLSFSNLSDIFFPPLSEKALLFPDIILTLSQQAQVMQKNNATLAVFASVATSVIFL